jgi:hypothetical protein
MGPGGTEMNIVFYHHFPVFCSISSFPSELYAIKLGLCISNTCQIVLSPLLVIPISCLARVFGQRMNPLLCICDCRHIHTTLLYKILSFKIALEYI